MVLMTAGGSNTCRLKERLLKACPFAKRFFSAIHSNDQINDAVSVQLAGISEGWSGKVVQLKSTLSQIRLKLGS